MYMLVCEGGYGTVPLVFVFFLKESNCMCNFPYVLMCINYRQAHSTVHVTVSTPSLTGVLISLSDGI